MKISQFLDLVEREALRDQGRSAPVRAKQATVRRWLTEVIALPVEWRERVATVPAGQGVDYALALIKAATGKRPPAAKDEPPAAPKPKALATPAANHFMPSMTSDGRVVI